eukprot:227059_1
MSFLTSTPVICLTVFVITLALCVQTVVLLNATDYHGLILKLVVSLVNAYARFKYKYQAPTSIGNHIQISHDLCMNAMGKTSSCQLVAMDALYRFVVPDFTYILHHAPHTLLDKLSHVERQKHLPFGTYFEEFDIHGINVLLIHSSPTGKSTKKKAFADGLVIHLHGGAFLVGSHISDAEFMSYLHLFSGLPVLAVDYRLAPKYPLQTGALLEDGVTVIKDYLHDHLAVDYNKIFLTGISAGGGAALMWMNEFAKHNIHFGGVIPISSWCDLDISATATNSYVENQKYDPILTFDAVTIMRMYVLGCRDSNGELVEDDVGQCIKRGMEDLKAKDMNPLSSDWSWGKHTKTKLLFVAAQYEVLRDDTVKAHEKAVENGMDSQLILMDNAMHTLLMTPHVPESQKYIAQIAHALHQWRTD